MQRQQDDSALVLAAVGLAFLLTVLNAGEAVLRATATPFVALFFLFLLKSASPTGQFEERMRSRGLSA